MRKLVLFFLLSTVSLFSQELVEDFPEDSPAEDLSMNALPGGYRDFLFGDTFEQVEQKLMEDPLFLYRGQPDVSILDEPNLTLIECRGVDFIQWASFHFYEGKLYIITLEMNPNRIDHFQIFRNLNKKYSDPNELDPSTSLWENENTLLKLERPITVKYIDKTVFEQIKQEGRAQKAYEEIAKEDFLDQF